MLLVNRYRIDIFHVIYDASLQGLCSVSFYMSHPRFHPRTRCNLQGIASHPLGFPDRCGDLRPIVVWKMFEGTQRIQHHPSLLET